MNSLSDVVLIISVAALGIVGPLVSAALLVWRRRRTRALRRSPLTADLLRPPGHSLRQELDTLRDAVDEHLLLLAIGPLAAYCVYLTQRVILSKPSATAGLMSVVAAIGFIVWGSWKLLQLSKRTDRIKAGLDAEMAVGQELDQLMRDGARVFHDVPAEGFNIDHVVVCAAGVYAVETKGRAKPIRGQGSKDATVVFDGSTLRFPTWTESAPLAQAQRQARWLGQWITSAVGASVGARAVLAIPGWYVDRQASGPVLIFNGKGPQFLLRSNRSTLTDEMVQRIAHQIEQRCRTVKPFYLK